MNSLTVIKLKAAIILFFLASPFYSIGAGIVTGFTPSSKGFEIPVSGTMRFDRIPFQFSFGLDAGSFDDAFVFGFSGNFDFLFLNRQILNNWSIYAGGGAAAALNFTKDFDSLLQIAPRIMIGMDWLFLDGYIQLFVQQAFEPTFALVKTTACDDLIYKFPIEAGIRLQF